MTLPSPLVLINSQSQLPNGVDVADNQTVTIALASTAGVYAWHVECIGTDDQNSAATINAGLVVNASNFTATFTAPHSADGYGAALIFKSTVNSGVDANGLIQPYLTTTFGVYVPTFITTVRLGAQNETTEGNAEYGWLTKINQAIRAGLFTGGFVNGDVTGPTLSNTVSFLQGHHLSVPSPTVNNVLTWNGFAWVDALPQGGILGGDVTGPATSNTVTKIQNVSVAVPVTQGNVAQVGAGPVVTWGPVNLGGGSHYVTGALPSGNQAPQNVGGDLSGTTASATVIGLQTRAVSSIAPTDGYVLTWVQHNNDWEPVPITSGSFTLGGDVTGPANANTVSGFQGRPFSSAAPSADYVIAWNAGHSDWEPTDPTTLPIVSWNDDLFHSTNTDQFVTAISGYPTSGGGTVNVHAGEFLIEPQNTFTIQGSNGSLGNPSPSIQIITGTGDLSHGGPAGSILLQTGVSDTNQPGAISLIAGNSTGGLSGHGGDITIQAASGVGSFTVFDGGNITLTPGSPGPAGGNYGELSITNLATFSYPAVTIDGRSINAASSMTLNSGTGSTNIYSDNNVGITGSSNVVIATAAAEILLNAKTKTVIQTNSAGIGSFTTSQFAFDAALTAPLITQDGGSGPSSSNLTIIGQNSSGDAGGTVYISAGGSAGTANGVDLTLQGGAQNQNGATQPAGNLVLKGGTHGGSGATGSPGSVIIISGPTATSTFAPNTVTLSYLSAHGNSLVYADNSGNLLNAGAFNGDVSGSWPTLTVTHINGTSVPSGPSANQVLVATSSSSSAWQLITNSNVDPSAAIAYSKLNLSNSIVNADVNTAAAIAGTKINPNFGSQNVSTTGTLSAGNSTFTSIKDTGLGAGVVHSDSSGNFTSSTISVSTDIAPGTAGQVLMSNATPTTTWTTLSGDVTVSATGVTTVNSISGSSPIPITPSELQFKNSTTNPLLDQAAPSPTNTPAAGQTFTVKAQAGTNALSGNNNGGNGGLLNLSSGLAGVHSGSGTDGVPGDLNLQTATNTVLTVSGSTYGTVAFANATVPTVDQAPLADTNTPANGATFTIEAQAGTNALSGNNNGGNGGVLILSSGLAGNRTGSGVQGTVGTLKLQTGGNDRLVINSSFINLPGFSVAGLIHNDNSGNLSTSLLVDVDVSNTANINVGKLGPGSSAQILISNSTPVATWVNMGGDVSLSSSGFATVNALQTHAVSNTAPSNGNVLTWSSGSNNWQPLPPAGGGIDFVGNFLFMGA